MNLPEDVDCAPAERLLVFDCEGAACVGVLAIPVGPPRRVGVVIVVGGPQYRVGSHRQFVLLARALAAAGFPALRFDYRGMGDSEGEARSFEAIEADLASAVTVLECEARIDRVVLWGLCDGATAALMYAARDPRIAGVVAVNPWAQPPEGTASTRLRHYYLRRLCSVEFWKKLFGGGVDVRGTTGDLAGVLRNSGQHDSAGYLQRFHDGWSRFKGPVLFILSGNDFTAREFSAWVGRDRQRTLQFRDTRSEICPMDDADHTFSSRAASRDVASCTADWLSRKFGTGQSS